MTPELAKALVAFRKVAPQISKTKRVQSGSYSYSYAPLDEIEKAISGPLEAAGLAVLQPLGEVNGHPAIITTILHESGDSITFAFPLAIHQGMTGQEIGSLVTYCRRYALVGALGLVTEEDDDAGHASNYQPPSKVFEPGVRDGSPVITFGKKHPGKTVVEVYATDPGYVEWIAENYEPRTADQQKIVDEARALTARSADPDDLVPDDIPF